METANVLSLQELLAPESEAQETLFQLDVSEQELLTVLKALQHTGNKATLEELETQLLKKEKYINVKAYPMSYQDFSLEQVKEKFNLKGANATLFEHIEMPDSEQFSFFKSIIERNTKVALDTEKVRSESIIFPLLVELLDRNPNTFTFFSGKTFEVDKQQGLTGRCDFLLCNEADKHSIIAPVFAIVEAKKGDIEAHLGQCVAEMVAARLYNIQKKHPYNTIYGTVTTGTEWLFLKLEGDTIFIDEMYYYGNELLKIIAIFQHIIDFYKTQK